MDNSYSSDVEGPLAPLSGVGITRNLYRRHLKRLLDIALVLIALPFLLPLMTVISIVLLLDGASPFYSQTRVGTGGRTFRMWKFRSMVPNADETLFALLASSATARLEWATHQKLQHDPRVTRVGRLLRRISLDELPQIWNVLRGDMSVVGPRPMMVSQTGLYPGREYYAVRPGLTGPWQVSARNQANFAARADYDRAYVERMSFLSDLVLIARTVGVIFRATGR